MRAQRGRRAFASLGSMLRSAMASLPWTVFWSDVLGSAGVSRAGQSDERDFRPGRMYDYPCPPGVVVSCQEFQ
jgi:hypothetical protein